MVAMLAAESLHVETQHRLFAKTVLPAWQEKLYMICYDVFAPFESAKSQGNAAYI